MVKGKNYPSYIRFRAKLKELAPDLVNDIPLIATRSTVVPIVMTEGKTDWKHLKAALSFLARKNLYANLQINFHEYEDEIEVGDVELHKICESSAKVPNPQPKIFIFDRDNRTILQKVTTEGKPYKKWRNNVFSFAIPIPDHRQATPDISIEFYYTDNEIKTTATSGKRLYISAEFDLRSRRHAERPALSWKTTRNDQPTLILDHDVFDDTLQNVALPKSHFADYVLKQDGNFKDFDFSAFVKIFEVIELIIKENF